MFGCARDRWVAISLRMFANSVSLSAASSNSIWSAHHLHRVGSPVASEPRFVNSGKRPLSQQELARVFDVDFKLLNPELL